MESEPDIFHPLIQEWFSREVGTPTDIQRQAWPVIGRGEHVLICAPTGSGKTLTAFLWAIHRLLSGEWEGGGVRVLYISPLKALNNDIERNLRIPLERLNQLAGERGLEIPLIRAAVRSGDTPQSERRKMLRHPPEILITTPESLNVLLGSQSGASILRGLRCVILDEIHAVAGVKRGAYLMSGIERLVEACGEFQRIAVSATVKPLEEIARFVGGYRMRELEGSVSYQERPVRVITSGSKKEYEILVQFPRSLSRGGEWPPGGLNPDQMEEEWWRALTQDWRQIISKNKSTILFSNSRRMSEKVARLINEGEPGRLVYSHHGSLSKEIRLEVERRLKGGELPAISSTSSLELGIDVGAVDQIVLIETPPAINSAIQRIGRSGHGVGQVSRGEFHPLHSRDFLNSAALAACIKSQDIEEVKPPRNCLDVLAQIILSMTLDEYVSLDEVYHRLRGAYSYHTLERREFDLVVEMLAGRYAETRLRELKPRLVVDRLRGRAKAREGTRRLLFMAGGVIPDRGYFNLRMEDSKAKVGELDEEFVWERSLGDVFPLGNNVWRIIRITHNDVEVMPAKQNTSALPFWRAGDMSRSFYFAEKIGLLLEQADTRLNRKEFALELMEKHLMAEPAAEQLISFLKRQREATGVGLPHRRRVVVEHFRDPMNASDAKQTVLHTVWGGRVNRPLGLAISQAWEERYGYKLEVFINNDAILLNLPHEFSFDDILTLLSRGALNDLLRAKLESTGYFGALFRENAGRSLLLPRRNFNQRMPLWMNRLRSKKLLEAVSSFEDFPVILETWRECVGANFEMERLESLLEEIRSGEIEVVECITRKPSPFTDGLLWNQTNVYMYEDDTPGSKLKSGLSDDLLKDVMRSADLRPALDPELVAVFTRKNQRTYEGYAPLSAEDLREWITDRLFIPEKEWSELQTALTRDRGDELAAGMLSEIAPDLIRFQPPGGDCVGILTNENWPRFARLIEMEIGTQETEARRDIGGNLLGTARLEQLEEYRQLEEKDSGANDDDLRFLRRVASLEQWLRYYDPLERECIGVTLGISQDSLRELLNASLENGKLIDGVEFKASADRRAGICDGENLEILLRITRQEARPEFEPLAAENLPLFLATWQGLTDPGGDPETLGEVLETLLVYPARLPLWESDILPARLNPYYTSWLDALLKESDLLWAGSGRARGYFCFPEDRDLLLEAKGQRRKQGELQARRRTSSPEPSGEANRLKEIFQENRGRFSFADLLELSGLDAPTLQEELWDLVWRGQVSGDDFEGLRRAMLGGFKPLSGGSARGGERRGALQRRRGSVLPGTWYRLPDLSPPADALEAEDLNREKLRLLFLRYGVLYREILALEAPSFRWSTLFRSLRIMELSGEIFAGRFFEGIEGIQFCSRRALRRLREELPPGKYLLDERGGSRLGLRNGTAGVQGSSPRSFTGKSHCVSRGARGFNF